MLDVKTASRLFALSFGLGLLISESLFREAAEFSDSLFACAFERTRDLQAAEKLRPTACARQERPAWDCE